MTTHRHLLWILYGAAVGFSTPFIFSDLLRLPLDLYYLVYHVIVGAFVVLYVARTQMDVRQWLSRRLPWGILLGLAVGAMMVMNVVSRPKTEHLDGIQMARMIVWRGILYGAVDGALLTAFPWLVTWRAFDVESKPLRQRIAFTALAWVFVLMMTTAYHAGYAEFRSGKITQPALGNSLISLATFVSGNPVASIIAHSAMHVAAVVHSPRTDLYLPPHRHTESDG